jgi:hypothetical protein
VAPPVPWTTVKSIQAPAALVAKLDATGWRRAVPK